MRVLRLYWLTSLQMCRAKLWRGLVACRLYNSVLSVLHNIRRDLDLSTLPALTPRQVSALIDEQLRRRQVLDAVAICGIPSRQRLCARLLHAQGPNMTPCLLMVCIDARCRHCFPDLRRTRHRHSAQGPVECSHSLRRAGHSSSTHTLPAPKQYAVLTQAVHPRRV